VSKGRGILVLLSAGLISFILSITVDMTNYELDALINYFWPPTLTVLAAVVYLITCWISKKAKTRIVVLTILSLYLLYVGLALHLEKDYWPLVLW
jgi:cytochrome bd-type quinol oxidase subunit 2